MKDVFLYWNTTSGENLSMIEPYLGEKVYKKATANRLSMDAELLRKTSKICNLTIKDYTNENYLDYVSL